MDGTVSTVCPAYEHLFMRGKILLAANNRRVAAIPGCEGTCKLWNIRGRYFEGNTSPDRLVDMYSSNVPGFVAWRQWSDED